MSTPFTERYNNKAQGSKLKFQRMKKQGMLESQVRSKENLQQGHFSPNSSAYCSQQRQDILFAQNQQLKEQNCYLKELTKIQNTKIQYQKEEERKNLLKEENYDQYKLLRKKHTQLQANYECTVAQLQALKRSVKVTKLKELESQITTCYQEIKRLNALNQKSNNGSVKEINQIIEREFFLGLENKELKSLILDQKEQIHRQASAIRKMKVTINQRQKIIQDLTNERREESSPSQKRHSLVQMVPKYELDAKKKDIISLTEAISILQKKVNDYQTKIGLMKQQQVQNINRQAAKRKELMVSYDNLKRSKQVLQETLIGLKKKNQSSFNKQDNTIKFTNAAELGLAVDLQPVRRKVPQTITAQHISNIIQEIVYGLQINNIDCQTAIENLTKDLEIVSIRQMMLMLEEEPYSLEDYNKRQLISRYLIQNSSNELESFVQYEAREKIEVVRSILKRLFDNYPLFSQQQEQDSRNRLEEYFQNTNINSRTLLSKGSRERTEYDRGQIIEELKRDQSMPDILLQFIKFKSYHLHNKKISVEQFFLALEQQSSPEEMVSL